MRVHRTISATLLAGVMCAVLPVGVTPAAAAPTPLVGEFNPIRNTGNGLCLQPASPADGEPIVQQRCVTDPGDLIGRAAQGWRFQRVANNHYQFLNQLSGECVDVFGPAANGTPVINGECKHISNEEFNTGAALPNIVALETRVGFRDNGFCIDVPGGQATPGLAVQVWQCNGTPAQRWIIGFAL